jgi:hypothetical protein
MGDYQEAANYEPATESDQIFAKLTAHETGKRVFMPSEDPIGLYNHAVNQFNARCNRTADGPLDKLDTNCFYSAWMIRWWVRLQAYRNPFFFILSVTLSTLIGFIPIINLVLFMLWLIVWILYERQAPLHKRNVEKSKDPYEKMIYAPEVCRRVGLTNMYYNLPISQMESFGLKPDQVANLKSRASGGTVLFMVYDDKFKAAYEKFWLLRWFHIANLLCIIIIIVIANIYVYPAFKTNEFFGSA